MEPVIRPALPEEIPVLAEIQKQAVHADRLKYGVPPPASPLEGDSVQVFSLLSGGQVCGGLCVFAEQGGPPCSASFWLRPVRKPKYAVETVMRFLNRQFPRGSCWIHSPGSGAARLPSPHRDMVYRVADRFADCCVWLMYAES